MILDVFIYIIKGIFQLLMWTWWLVAGVIALMAWQNFRKSRWIDEHDNVILSVKVPKNNEKGPIAAEMMFASLHGILKSEKDIKKEGSIQEHIGFEIVSGANAITFYVWVPRHLQDFVEGQIYAQYPTAEVVEVKDYCEEININPESEDFIAGTELALAKADYFPIKTFMNFDVDPLAAITGALSKIESESEKVWIQILTRPASDKWRNKGLAYAESLKKGTALSPFSKQGMAHSLLSLPTYFIAEFLNAILPSPAASGEKPKEKKDEKLPHNIEVSLTGIEEKANKLGFQVKIRVIYVAKSKELAKERLRMAVGAFKQFNTTNLNGFSAGKIRAGEGVLRDYRSRLFTENGFILNIEEIASLYHMPHTSVETPSIVWTSSKKGEPPSNLPYLGATEDKDLTTFGETTFRGKPKTFGIKRDDRRRHMYIIGKSGVGKSKLLELLAISDIKRGEGVAIVDPHGETIASVMKHIPDERVKDVIYFNPADRDFPIGFNPLETTPELREETASGFISVFKRLFGYSWGPRLEYVLRYTVLALTYDPEATMLGVVRMLTDKNYRKKVVSQVEDPVVKSFWLKEFTTYNDRFATEAVAPILNKVGQFTASPIIRNMVGQVKSTVDFKEAMNNQKILLVDLSTGKIGEDNSQLLGSMIITKLQLTAMTRAKIREEDRKDFFLYVDEFQNFATESFATILSEARKYRLSLTLANQYIAQMEEPVRDAVFGNVGTLISFRVGATDATFLEKEFNPVFEQNDLINLDNQHIYLRMLIDGVTSLPFSAKTLFVPKSDDSNVEKIIEVSRMKFGTTRSSIEDAISKWSAIDSIDVDQKIENQPVTAFEMTNEQLEGGQQPQKKKRKKKKKRGGSPDNQPSNQEPGISLAENPVLQAALKATSGAQAQEKPQGTPREAQKPNNANIDPESLKKVIESVVTPSKDDKATETKVTTKDQHNEKRSPQVVQPKRTPRIESGENVKEISKEEFLTLREIGPNEQIIIKEKNITPPTKNSGEVARPVQHPENDKEKHAEKDHKNSEEIKPGETIYFK